MSISNYEYYDYAKYVILCSCYNITNLVVYTLLLCPNGFVSVISSQSLDGTNIILNCLFLPFKNIFR